jgi:ubiquitin-protein ligase E3 A
MVTGLHGQLFRPEELELLICGNPELDFEALESAARYDDGFTEHSTIIKNFWEVVHEFSLEDKKKFLVRAHRACSSSLLPTPISADVCDG